MIGCLQNLQTACKTERNGEMNHKILLADIPTAVLIALVKRAIADRWSHDCDIRDNAAQFLRSVSPSIFKTPSFRHSHQQVGVAE
jgi:hypothetical protein